MKTVARIYRTADAAPMMELNIVDGQYVSRNLGHAVSLPKIDTRADAARFLRAIDELCAPVMFMVRPALRGAR